MAAPRTAAKKAAAKKAAADKAANKPASRSRRKSKAAAKSALIVTPPLSVPRDPDAEIIVGLDPKLFAGQVNAAVVVDAALKPLVDNFQATIVSKVVWTPPAGTDGLAFAVIRIGKPGESLATLQATLKKHQARIDYPGIKYVERQARIVLAASGPDPLARWQWALRKVGADKPWKVPAPGGSTVVAIIDSGLRRPGGGLPEDIGNVLPANVCQPAGMYPDCIDQYGHGTYLAGTIAALTNNALGIASPVPDQTAATWGVTLMPIKFFGTQAPPLIDDAATAILQAVTAALLPTTDPNYLNVRVINASWHVAPGGDKKLVRDAIKAANDADVLVVAAAGNDGTDNDVYPTYPANYGNPGGPFPNAKVLAVAATAQDDFKASFSNYSPTLVDIAAPGQHIQTTGNYFTGPARYPSYNGTSASTALVSSAAALVFALNPDWTAKEVQTYLKDAADKLPSLRLVCQDGTTSGNRLNMDKAVNGPVAWTAPDPATNPVLHKGSTVPITWSERFTTAKIKKVKIEFSHDDQATWTSLKTVKITDHVYAWPVKASDVTSGAKGWLRITPTTGNFQTIWGPFIVSPT